MQPAYNGVNGSTPLPAPDAGDVILLVVKPGDKANLLSDAGIRTMLLGATSHFANLIRLRNLDTSPQPKPASLQFHGSAPSLAQRYFNEWLNAISQQTGLSRPDIESAISLWIKKTTFDLDRALSSLYQGALDDTVIRLTKLKSRRDNENKELLVAVDQVLGFSYTLQGKYFAAEEALRQAFVRTEGRDHNFLLHLGNVLILDGKPQEAKQAFDQAWQIVRDNGFVPLNKIVQPTPDTESPEDQMGSFVVPLRGLWQQYPSGQGLCVDITSQKSINESKDEFECEYKPVCTLSGLYHCKGAVSRWNDSIIVSIDGEHLNQSYRGSLNLDRDLITIHGDTPASGYYLLVPEINIYKAKDHIGKRAIVCGEVREVISTQSRGVRLMLTAPPNYKFNISITDLNKLPEGWARNIEMFAHKTVCGRGLISEETGELEITIDAPIDFAIRSMSVTTESKY